MDTTKTNSTKEDLEKKYLVPLKVETYLDIYVDARDADQATEKAAAWMNLTVTDGGVWFRGNFDEPFYLMWEGCHQHCSSHNVRLVEDLSNTDSKED